MLFGNRNQNEKIGIAFHQDGISLVGVVASAKNAYTLSRCLFFPADNKGNEDVFSSLEMVIKSQRLKKKPVRISFPARHYRLLLIDKPKIPDEEISNAIRWKVKDLVDLQSEKLLVTTFSNPEPPPTPDHSGQIYLVVADELKIEHVEKMFRDHHAQLAGIELRELAQRDIAALVPEETKGLALVTLDSDGGMMTFSKAGEMYLSRRLEVAFDAFGAANIQEYVQRVINEIQRSIDYFDRHFKGFALQQLAGIRPYFLDDASLANISANLSLPCKWIRLSELLPNELLENESRQSIFTQTIGVALASD